MIVPILFILSLLYYTGILFILLNGFKRINACNDYHIDDLVSIIIAVKNEEQIIKNCLEALLAQDYQAPLEIIVIDDGSSDMTFDVLKNYEQQNPYLTIIRIDNHNEKVNVENESLNKQIVLSSKKYALTKGIERAKGELLLFTDADCVPPITWVKEMVACFARDVGFVAGFAPWIDRTGSVWGKLIELDSVVAATIAAGGFGINKAITCTGRNVAYRKRVFEEVNGFTDIYHSISGDDDLFLHLVVRKTEWKIKYNISPATFVPSYQTKTLARFVWQKRRHISAGRYYPRKLQIVYTTMHLINLGIYLFVLIAIISNQFFITAITLFLIKIMSDFVFIRCGTQKFNRKKLTKYFLLWELFYLVYNIVVSPLAMSKRFRW